MDKDIFRNHNDSWLVADNIKKLYMSDGSILSLLDFERVLDELDLYAFKNWSLGELVSGPVIGRYKVSCTFMYPASLMPDPRGGRRLLPFDCEVKFKKTEISIPIKVEDPDDYLPGTHKARLIKRPVWLVEITMPKSLMTDIRTGSIDLEDESIDLEDLDQAYEKDIDQEEFKNEPAQQPAPGQTNAQPQQPIAPSI